MGCPDDKGTSINTDTFKVPKSDPPSTISTMVATTTVSLSRVSRQDSSAMASRRWPSYTTAIASSKNLSNSSRMLCTSTSGHQGETGWKFPMELRERTPESPAPILTAS